MKRITELYYDLIVLYRINKSYFHKFIETILLLKY